MNDDQVEKIIKELRDIRGIMRKAYQLFWVASLLLLLILIVNFQNFIFQFLYELKYKFYFGVARL